VRTLVVGGTGLTGAQTALHLADLGHEVTTMSRFELSEAAPVAHLPHRQGNYVEAPPTAEELKDFENIIFCAGADIRTLPEGVDPDRYYHQANAVALPRFFEQAKNAGVRNAIHIGSFYPHIVPAAVTTVPYLASRYDATQAVLAMNSDAFKTCSLDAPPIVGYLPGVALDHLFAIVHYVLGRIEGLPIVAPGGSMNFIASTSMAEAVASAIHQGDAGHAYLVGDENLTWKEFLELFAAAAGCPQDLPVSEDEHPLFPDMILYAGRNAEVVYEPEMGSLQYSRGQIGAAVQAIVDGYLNNETSM